MTSSPPDTGDPALGDVLAWVRRLGIDPKRSLGQNFLVDRAHLDRIVAAAALSSDDTVLEIGPGPGTLTARLAAQAAPRGLPVVAVELDDRLIEPLRRHFAPRGNVKIIHGDILKLDPVALLPAGTSAYKVVANLPYYITSAVLRHILEASLRPTLAVVMVQKEVAQRICAQPGDLSLLAVSVQVYAEPRLLHVVPAGAFYPQPKVDSAVVRLDVRPTPALAGMSAERFFRVVRAGFGQKRKQLGNSLAAGLSLPKATAAAALRAAGIDPMRRAETLSLDEWGALCAVLA